MLILRGKRVSPMDEVLKPRKLLKKDPETMAVELKDENLEKEDRRRRGAEKLGKTKRRDHPGEGRGGRGQEKGKKGVPDRIP